VLVARDVPLQAVEDPAVGVVEPSSSARAAPGSDNATAVARPRAPREYAFQVVWVSIDF
jgi:hypothetical protein